LKKLKQTDTSHPVEGSRPFVEASLAPTPTNPTPAQPQSTAKKIIKKFVVGKSPQTNKVSVLIKNKQTRKNTHTQMEQLVQTPIQDQKKYLKDHGIIKVGSVAPNEIIRQLYENTVVAGEIQNVNSNALLDGFING
jgi:hypothetical protein